MQKTSRAPRLTVESSFYLSGRTVDNKSCPFMDNVIMFSCRYQTHWQYMSLFVKILLSWSLPGQVATRTVTTQSLSQIIWTVMAWNEYIFIGVKFVEGASILTWVQSIVPIMLGKPNLRRKPSLEELTLMRNCSLYTSSMPPASRQIVVDIVLLSTLIHVVTDSFFHFCIFHK